MSERNLSINSTKKINFGAGPSYLPDSVLVDSATNVLSIPSLSTGESILEISHRSATFKNILEETESKLRNLLEIPDNYRVLFMQGGGTGQFASAPLNILAHHYGTDKTKGGYLVSGTWSLAAYKEAEKLNLNPIEIFNTKKLCTKFDTIPSSNQWHLADIKADSLAYLYYCANETVNGVEIFDLPSNLPPQLQDIDIVCDMSSNILGRKVDVSKYAVIFAGAQKNLGPSGITVVIVRQDILDRQDNHKIFLPSVMDYKIVEQHGSAHNTPPTFAIQSLGFALKYYTELTSNKGGIEFIEQVATEKAKILYDVLDKYPSIFKVVVKDTKARSLTNIVFELKDQDTEKNFLKEADINEFINVKGHRSVGGIRISLYNATLFRTNDPVNKLVAFLDKFANENK